MGKGIPFEGCNKTFVPAPGTEDRVRPIEVFDNGQSIVQCWAPQKETTEDTRPLERKDAPD